MPRRAPFLLLLSFAASLLLAGAPSAQPPAAPAPAVSVKAVPPGTGISPSIDDPVRVQLILKLIRDVYEGNPLRFPRKDGTVWTNRERSLPVNTDPDWYREYTLLPPAGSASIVTVGGRAYKIAPPQGTRGVERIIIGGGQSVFYTPDHYRTFIELTILR